MIRVLLVDDQELMRRGLRKMLEIEEGIEVVGEAADGVQALAQVRETRPDVALVDARMPHMDGVELITRLSAEFPSVAAIVLTTFDEDEYIFGALRGGAVGYLLKDCSPDDVVEAVRRTSRGETVLGSPAAARLVAHVRRTPAPYDVPRSPDARGGREAESLSARELDVARMVAAGASNREIAARLLISEGTVRNHVSSVLRKLGLRDRIQLALHLTRR
ncbi:response regulator [Nonomuraea roseoviolacea]|uniref:DNA-binding NarL/FixJ family response regulator n=1 Tax=Nonomuraea roseoviolacea subsp. carminata TaxID=160689 RepID=A0ABT1JW44_9ACTN|nr:response regulator transcription factor [Nonomuraea roseoviolacea]MCP2345973.1 DNA-binding NarL/FixJ family response regulator [Nonomuraea roseoviolacea subsp. carminata]